MIIGKKFMFNHTKVYIKSQLIFLCKKLDIFISRPIVKNHHFLAFLTISHSTNFRVAAIAAVPSRHKKISSRDAVCFISRSNYGSVTALVVPLHSNRIFLIHFLFFRNELIFQLILTNVLYEINRVNLLDFF